MILRGNFYSETLQSDTGINIVVPNKYNKKEQGKVIYLYHGMCANSSSWLDNTLVNAYANKYNCIIIMADAGRSYYKDMVLGQKYFTYLAVELPEVVDRIFNISSKREDTIAIGGSMGGYGALKIALTYPERFGTVCALAPAGVMVQDFLDVCKTKDTMEERKRIYGSQVGIDMINIFGPDFAYDETDDVFLLAQKCQKANNLPNIYLTCGTEDELIAENRKFKAILDKANIPYKAEETEGGHNWKYFNETLKHALNFAIK